MESRRDRLPLGAELHLVRLDQGVDPAAGRVAEVPGLRVAEVADSRGGQPLEQLRLRALDLQQRPLVARPAERVVADVPVAAHDPVARDQQRHRVLRQRRPRRAHGARAADLPGDPAVRPDLAGRDLERLHQDGPLELGETPEVEPQPARVPALAPALEVPDERPHGRRRHGLLAVDLAPEVLLESAPELGRGLRSPHHRDPRLAVGDEHRADRRLEPPVGIGQADPPQHGRKQRRGRLLERHPPQGPGHRQSVFHRLHFLTPFLRDATP